MIRDFHDAAAAFTPPSDARWQALMPADGEEIIAHHDLAPRNLIIGSRQWAFIDWVGHRSTRNPAVGPGLRPARLRPP